MLSMAFGSFICLILGIIAVASLSHHEDVVMDTYWVHFLDIHFSLLTHPLDSC
jgi:hypothetical protein